MDKIDIKNLSKDELKRAMAGIGEEPYRAVQIFRWLYKEGPASSAGGGASAQTFDDMTDLSEGLREKLKSKFHMTKLVLLDSKRSLIDGTVKYLFKLEDANTIESVYLPEPKRTTLCLSSQVGCKFGCNFCATSLLVSYRST